VHTPADSYFSQIRLPGIGPHFTGRFRWAGYALALLIAGGMAVARFALNPLLGHESPLLPFVLVVVAAAYLGGRGPGLLSLVTSVLLAQLFFAHLSGSGRQALSWAGHLSLFAIVGALITEGIHRLQHAAAVLRDAELRMRAILDRASAVVFFKDRDGRYLFVNEEFLRIFAMERQAVIGKKESELFPAAIAQDMRAHDARVWESGMHLTAEEMAPRVDGLRTYVSTKFLLRDAEGAPYALCGIATDITAQKNTEEALRQADRRKDIFLATLSHELRNPLAPIRHAAQLLRNTPAGSKDAVRAQEIIERQSQHLSRLLDDLLDVSRITRGSVELRKTVVPLSSVIDTALEAVRPLIEARHHAMQLDVAPPAIYVEGDAVRLSQVLANLLTNAAKYTPPGGRISIHARVENGAVVLRVIDNGTGIAPDVLPRIFEMFSQGRTEREHADGGLGIGLALVRGLLELHGGTVEARSDGPGRGSEFIVRVPAAAAPVSMEPIATANVSEPVNSSAKVLIADDNRDAADSLAILLEGDGHDVRKAYDGTDALDTARAFKPNVALLDIGMPGLSGYEVAQRIRAEAWGGEIVLIALTGWGQSQDKARALSAGFDHHVTKPVEPEKLQDLMALGRRKVAS
jgi:PAS domain S-box-containing protein